MTAPFIQDRDTSRRYFLAVWEKHRTGSALEPLEGTILEVILEHPEYHDFLEEGEKALEQEFNPESGRTNPFLHMGLHIAIREQVATDRPGGIRGLHQQLAGKTGSAHEAEHLIMECLGEILWKAQRGNTLPDEEAYLEMIKRLV